LPYLGNTKDLYLKKALKIGLRILAVLLLLCFMALLGAYWYIGRNKEQIRLLVEQEFNTKFYGTLHIGAIEPNMWKQFPGVSLDLNEVSIRDTGWSRHHIDLLHAAHLYMKLEFWPLLKGDVQMDQLLLEQAEMNLWVDADSSSNKSVFVARKQKKKKGKASLAINVIKLRNFRFRFRNEPYKKRFDFEIPELSGRVANENDQLQFLVQSAALVHEFSFNTEKGSYFKDQKIKFDIRFDFDPKKNLLQVRKQFFVVGDQRLQLSGDFYTAKADNWFATDIAGKQIDYRKGLSWVPPTVYASLKGFIFERPLDFKMHIEGRLKDQRIPFVALGADFNNNKLDSKFGQFDSLSFHLNYVNGNKHDSLYGDEYSFMKLSQLKGQFYGIPFTADTTTVQNLKCSQIKTHVRADFPVKKLNSLFGRESFHFGDGNVMLDLQYEGGIKEGSKYPMKITATADLKRIDMTYLPRNLKFHDCNVVLNILNNDVRVVESQLNTERSTVFITAYSNAFLSEFRSRPENILIEASVRSKHIDLNEFRSFLQSRPAAVKSKKNSDKGTTPDFLDEALDLSKTHLQVAVDKVSYKRFEATQIRGDLMLLPNGIELNSASLRHADGTLNLSGSLRNTDALKPSFSIKAKIEHTAIDKLLYAFDNFGQRSFYPENIRGTINMDSKLDGQLSDSNSLIGSSLRGTAAFDIRNGALINFRPLRKVGRFVFSKERLSEVNFERIHNTLTIRGNEIDIPPMWVNTDLIDLQMQGVYGMNGGTDILLEVPLFRFSKQDIAADSNLSHAKGFRLYIQAKDDEKGETHFKLKLRNSDITKENQERKRLKELRKQRKQQRQGR
jgi:hypothetical protein